MNRTALSLACRQFACMALLAGPRGAVAQAPGRPSGWTNRPRCRAGSRRATRPSSATAPAARFGSVEAEYRLRRLLLLLGRDAAPEPAMATALLALAAQRGHEKARGLLAGRPPGEALPDCLVTGEAPVLDLKDSAREVVP